MNDMPQNPYDPQSPPDPTPAQPPTEPVHHEPAVVVQTAPRGRGVFWGLVGGCLVVFVLLTIASVGLAMWAGTEERTFALGDKIAVVPIEGEILESREINERLERYADDGSVKGVVVRINSPGGGVVPSQEIFAQLRRLRQESGKPFIASMDSVAASGGYYIAAGCDHIVANPGTITGSIGVIAQWFNLEDLVKWAKMKPETITSGRMKDAGSPFRPLSENEREYFQTIVEQLHNQFIRAVAEGRQGQLSEAEVTALADGRAYTGEQALQLKLVDQLGTLDDAIAVAAERGGIKGEPRTIYPRERVPGLLELLLGGSAESEAFMRRLQSRFSGYQFLYRWY